MAVSFGAITGMTSHIPKGEQRRLSFIEFISFLSVLPGERWIRSRTDVDEFDETTELIPLSTECNCRVVCISMVFHRWI